MNVKLKEIIDFYNNNQLDRAKTLSEQAILNDPNPKILNILGVIYYKQNNNSEAIKYFDKEFPNVQQLICTLGPEGVLILDEGKQYNFYSAEANVIDKTGEDDFFAAGYFFGLQNGLTISESADIANKSAAHVISEIGVRPKNKFD